MLTRLTSNAAVANGRMEVSRLRVTTRRKAADIRSANELAPKLIHTSGGAASIVNRVAAGITETAAQKTTRTRATKRSPPAPASMIAGSAGVRISRKRRAFTHSQSYRTTQGWRSGENVTPQTTREREATEATRSHPRQRRSPDLPMLHTSRDHRQLRKHLVITNAEQPIKVNIVSKLRCGRRWRRGHSQSSQLLANGFELDQQ